MDTLDDNQDPDYAASVPSDQTQQEAYEENARAKTTRKITDIVEKEFSKEIDSKEKEVLQIQDRLDDALKTLHLLRYAIVTDFYNRKQCQAPDIGESKQTRIHPAVKKLIGKSPRLTRNQFIDIATPSTSKDPRFIDPETPSTSKNSSHSSEGEKNVNSEKNSKQQNAKRSHSDSSGTEPPKKVPRYIPPKSAIPEPSGPSRGHRNKVRKRIIVGNFSKWIPPKERDGRSTHRWTMYVRGSKENPKIDDFVKKVWYLLDPSFKPNDIVDTTSPFYLSRHGWGEFPIRVQLEFKNALNKPVDIIHHLKLDRTFTGLQTLGAETVVDIWIQMSEPRSLPDSIPDSSKNKKADLEVTHVPITKSKSSQEKKIPKPEIKHETSAEEISSLKFYALMDHDYCHSSSKSVIIENNRTIAHLPNGSIEPVLQNGPIAEKNIPNGLSNDSVSGSNTNKVNMQKLATNLKDSPGKMQPLQITIPRAFETPNKKQFLILKNKDCVPVKFDPKSKILIDPVTIQKKVNDISSKKDGKVFVKEGENPVHKNSEKSKLLKINPANSILLTANYSEPALKIVDSTDPQHLNEDLALQNFGMKAGSHFFKPEIEFKDKTKLGKTKVTLGKYKGKMMSNKEIYEGVMRSIDDVRLKDTLSLVKFIIHRLPLVSEDASNPEYKRLYPFSCSSREEFLSYNIGKQRAFEWQRAKAVRTVLKNKVPEEELWSIKEIIIWARRHAYTPMSSIFESQKSSAKEAKKTPSSGESILLTCTEPVDLNKWLSESSNKIQGSNQDSESDEEIDVVSEEKPSDTPRLNNIEKAEEAMVLDLPSESESLCAFVNETTREIGIRLTDEEIIPGVRHCAASHVMMRAVECFVENLVRLSHAKAIDGSENKNSNVESINLEDVRQALFKREEFDLFTNAGLGTQPTGKE